MSREEREFRTQQLHEKLYVYSNEALVELTPDANIATVCQVIYMSSILTSPDSHNLYTRLILYSTLGNGMDIRVYSVRRRYHARG